MKKRLKTFMAMTFIIALTAGIAPLCCVAKADERPKENCWEDMMSADYSFMTPGNVEFASQSDAICSNLYHIKTADQLASVLQEDNPHYRLVLDNDIDMLGATGRVWNLGNSFSGILDGQNHTISNLNLTGGKCFFSKLNRSGIIENVSFKLSSSDSSGALIDKNYGLLTNVHVTVADDSTYSGSRASVLTGNNYGTIKYCSANGDFKAEAEYGFASIASQNQGSISDCVFNGSVKSVNHAAYTYAMVGYCASGSHTARLICNCDPQDSTFYDMVDDENDSADIDFATIYYPGDLILGNSNSRCSDHANIASLAVNVGYDTMNIYETTKTDPVQFIFDQKKLESFNNQVSTTGLTLNINGEKYPAKVYKNLKVITFEAPLLLDLSDESAQYSITGTLDGNAVEDYEMSAKEVQGEEGLWSELSVGGTTYNIFYETKAGTTYFMDLDFSNVIKYMHIDGSLNEDHIIRVGFSFAGDPGDITAANAIARWFSDNLALRSNRTLMALEMMAPAFDMSYNGQVYPTGLIFTLPDDKKADWTAELGPVPQWAIDQAKNEYLEAYEKDKTLKKPEEMTDDDYIKGKYDDIPPASYVTFTSNHDGTKIENNISEGDLLLGVWTVLGSPEYTYSLNSTYDSVKQVNGKNLLSYNTSMEAALVEKEKTEGTEETEGTEGTESGFSEQELEKLNKMKSLVDLEVATTITPGSSALPYNVKVKSTAKGKAAEASYEYILESASVGADGKEVRKTEAQKKISSSDANGLLGTIEVSYADLLDKKTNTFKDQNTVKYYVRQLPGSDKDVTYDKSEYTIEILVKVKDKALKSVGFDAKDIKVYKDGVLTSLTPEQLSFENVYNAPKESKTDPGKVTLKKPASVKLVAKKGAIQVSWKTVKDAASYQIQISTKKNFKKAKLLKKKLKKKEKSKKKLSYNCKKLKKKTKYYIRVRAVDSKGQFGPWSKTICKKTK